MSQEKQTIEEMAKIIREAEVQYVKERVKAIEHDLIEPIPPRGTYIASQLYDAGYSKQSEGEWKIKSEIYILIDDVDEELFVECSICQRRFNVPYEFDDEKIFKYAREHYPYCHCGAKMKGGTENEPKRIY